MYSLGSVTSYRVSGAGASRNKSRWMFSHWRRMDWYASSRSEAKASNRLPGFISL